MKFLRWFWKPKPAPLGMKVDESAGVRQYTLDMPEGDILVATRRALYTIRDRGDAPVQLRFTEEQHDRLAKSLGVVAVRVPRPTAPEWAKKAPRPPIAVVPSQLDGVPIEIMEDADAQ